jgi:phospholipase C
MANQLSAIQHIVVLALENRSFDQMLGFLYTDQGNRSPTGQPYEGLTGNESNPGTDGKPVKVFKITPNMKNAYFMPGCDPGEDYVAVNQQLFDSVDPPSPPIAKNQGFLKNFAKNLPARTKNKMFGAMPGTVPNNIMGMFAPETLPILSGLARGFAVCDHWFCSVPTETMPNRAFMCAGTSCGKLGDSHVTPFHTKSIFGLLSDAKIDWMIYGYTAPPLTANDFPDTLSADKSHFGKFADFKSAAAAGKLPAYSFLEPEWSKKGNSQHPNLSDVALGEKLIHDVYYALRDGKHWNQTLLIVTYDEHGGNFDHVPPPLGATTPDDSAGDQGFDFKRFGVRVPAVLVSPLIVKGTVFRVPDGTTPIDHTSIIKTVERRWGLTPLTARDGTAPDLGDALTLATARTDDPLDGVQVPVSSGSPPNSTQPSPLQQIHADAVADLPVVDKLGRVDRQMPTLRSAKDYATYIKQRTAAWQKSQEARQKAKPKAPRASPPPSGPQYSAAAPGTVTAPVTWPAQVVILRHGEKPSDPRNPNLSPAGVARADMLATAIPQNFPNPNFLFAAAPSKHSNRPVETLTPLARALTMRLDTSVPENEYQVLAADLFEMPEYAGKLIIICWHHGNIPDLALALKVPEGQINDATGMQGMHWDPKVFDSFWSITFANQTATLTITKQPPVPIGKKLSAG